ncbi:hypothetical protein P7C73_g777, partial [Tremellales sp. Uapishka_1]
MKTPELDARTLRGTAPQPIPLAAGSNQPLTPMDEISALSLPRPFLAPSSNDTHQNQPSALSSLGGTTIKAPNSLARHVAEYRDILANFGLSASSQETVKPRMVVVDEIQVEDCFVCGANRKREEVVLKGVEGQGNGLQWVCKRCETARQPYIHSEHDLTQV